MTLRTRLARWLEPSTINALERNRDLMAEVTALSSAKPMTAQQWADVSRVQSEHLRLTKEATELMCYLRDRYPEILTGVHASMTIVQLINFYLEHEKRNCAACDARRNAIERSL